MCEFVREIKPLSPFVLRPPVDAGSKGERVVREVRRFPVTRRGREGKSTRRGSRDSRDTINYESDGRSSSFISLSPFAVFLKLLLLLRNSFV